ncbi:MAG: twin transmembrane helix small protein [Gammaproteobacteria bacterium]|nr:twin transmembrane helix small protein [Gammaproteobacteria bacterium]
MKFLVVILLLVILASLFSALVFLVRDRGTTHRTVRALTWRIGLSIGLFLLLLLAGWMGWIEPHGLRPRS